MRRYVIAVLVMLVTACASYGVRELDERYGQPNPARYDKVTPASQFAPQAQDGLAALSFQHDIKPILEQRCTVCHGCYDAPCQLKLDSFEGLTRGANKDKVYDGTRLIAANLTRLFEDAHTNAQWRGKGFYPVLNERENSPQANLEGSVLYNMLRLKRENPLPVQYPLSESFDFSLNREQSCPKIEEFADLEEEHPLWGMPFGMPAVSDREFDTLKRWIEQGSPRDEPAAINTTMTQKMQQWELFLNGNTPKQQLMSRYIYEHWFLAHLFFTNEKVTNEKVTNEKVTNEKVAKENATKVALNRGQDDALATIATDASGARVFFKLVRSKTPPGQPIDLIPTRRPFDDPGVARVYYRLQRDVTSVSQKNHLPYRLDAQRMQRLQSLFLDTPYNVTRLPSYEPEVASNPFRAFAEIPARSRYKMMLDEAEFTIMGFIKGPVCRGQVALNVIEDHFWVYFVNPDMESMNKQGEFLAQHSDDLRMPAERESTTLIVTGWLDYSHAQKKYLQEKAKFLRSLTDANGPPNLNLVWDGGHTNTNAALTVWRHVNAATVVRGNIGKPPKTAWLIDYSLLERIHYLLVAGFDVYGNVGHQLNTRLYMDFLRMEGEYNFLTLLPRDVRLRERDFWYRGAEGDVREYLSWQDGQFNPEPAIKYHTAQPKLELFGLLQQHIGSAIYSPLNLTRNDTPALSRLEDVHGIAASLMPQLSVLRIDNEQSTSYITITNNNAHSNISSPFEESKRRLKQEDTLSVMHGVVGSYPNAFFHITTSELEPFVKRVATLSSEDDYRALARDFGVARNSSDFWPFSDRLVRDHFAAQPVDSGLLDYNRLENR